jgi:aminoglycoside phosphotransferase (APT) family kinase protein
MCYDLLISDIPMSLEHGNFRPDNVIESGSHWQYFDWTESAVTHPFFDMFFFLLTVEAQLPDHPDARTRLRDAYLESWTAYQPLEALIQVFQTAMPVAALHHALIYHRFVLPRMESRARWQIAPHLNHLLRLLLDLMEQSSL